MSKNAREVLVDSQEIDLNGQFKVKEEQIGTAAIKTINYIKDHPRGAGFRNFFFWFGSTDYDTDLAEALLSAPKALRNTFFKDLNNDGLQIALEALYKGLNAESKQNNPKRFRFWLFKKPDLDRFRFYLYKFATKDVTVKTVVDDGEEVEEQGEKIKKEIKKKVKVTERYKLVDLSAIFNSTQNEGKQEVDASIEDGDQTGGKSEASNKPLNKKEHIRAYKIGRVLEALQKNKTKVGRKHHTPDILPFLGWEKDWDRDVFVIIEKFSILGMHKEMDDLIAGANEDHLAKIKEINEIKDELEIEIEKKRKEIVDNENIIKKISSNEKSYRFVRRNIELKEEINTYLKAIQQHNDEIKNAHTNLINDLSEAFHFHFNALSTSVNVEPGHVAAIGRLATEITHFNKSFGKPKRIFNIEKLIALGKYDQYLEKYSTNNKYIYIPDLTLKDEDEIEKERQRNTKKWLDRISKFITTVIAICEGAVALIFFLGALTNPVLLAVAILIGIAGFIANYVLCRQDTYETLRSLFIKGIFTDANGLQVSNIKKVAIVFTWISSLATAAVFGIYAFGAIHSVLFGLFAGTTLMASAAFPPILLGVVAFLVIIETIALAAVLISAVANFIKNDNILKVSSYLKENYGYNCPEGSNRALYSIKWLGKVLFNSTFLLVGAAACIAMALLTFGLGHNKAVAGLKLLPFLPSKIIEVTSKWAVIVAAPITDFFYSKGMLMFTNRVKSIVSTVGIGLATFIRHPKDTIQSIKKSWAEFNSNPLRKVAVIAAAIKTFILGVSVAGNAKGMGDGPRHTAEAFQRLEVLGVPSAARSDVAGDIAMTASAGPNSVAAEDSTAVPGRVKMKGLTLAEANEANDRAKKRTHAEITPVLSESDATLFHQPQSMEGNGRQEVEEHKIEEITKVDAKVEGAESSDQPVSAPVQIEETKPASPSQPASKRGKIDIVAGIGRKHLPILFKVERTPEPTDAESSKGLEEGVKDRGQKNKT